MDEMNNMNETTVMENENSVEVVPEENIQMIENEETSGIDPKLVLGAAVIAGAAIVGGIKHLKSKKNKQLMMNLECILYGCKGLFFGLIASVGVTYLIYLSLRNQMILDFYIPWYSVVIAVFSVFFVVFCTMLYAMRKIQKDNVAETLKSDVF